MDAPGGPGPATASRLLDEPTAQRLAGPAQATYLRCGELQAGAVGVLEAEVRRVQATHEFQRRDGTPGRLRRVTLADPTGEADLVLWGDETDLAADALAPGRHVRLRGPTVRDGFRGGVELHLGAAALEPLLDDGQALAGTLAHLAESEIVNGPDGPRFRAEARIDTRGGPRHVVLWDDAIKQAIAAGPGQPVAFPDARPNPAVDGWFIVDPSLPGAQPS